MNFIMKMTKPFCSSVFFMLAINLFSGLAQGVHFYDFSVDDASGSDRKLSLYKGKLTLVTNVASHCGYTDAHYIQYVRLLNEFGFEMNILAFPCNQFGEQEPDDVATIIKNIKDTYAATFPVFAKIDVTGEHTPDAWRYLIEQTGVAPTWNFFKYLVDPDGKVLGGWGPDYPFEQLKERIQEEVDKLRRRRTEL